MGLSCSVLAPKDNSCEGTNFFEEEAKEALPLPEKSTESPSQRSRSIGSEKQPAPPSVVIPWVFQEVAESLTETDHFRRSVMLDKHAARLRLCWKQYGEDFPNACAAELLRLKGTDVWESKPDEPAWKTKKSQLLTFLLTNFAAERKDTANLLRIKRGSKDLWHPLLKEFERAGVRRGPDWTSPDAALFRTRIQQLLDDVEAAGSTSRFWHNPKFNFDLMRVQLTGYASESARKLLEALNNVREKVARVDRDAAKVALEAKKEPIKASLKPAPWEVD